MSNELGNGDGSRIKAAIQAYDFGVQLNLPAEKLAKPMSVLFGEPGQQVVEALDPNVVDSIILVVCDGLISRRDGGEMLPLDNKGNIDPLVISELRDLHGKQHVSPRSQIGNIVSEVFQKGVAGGVGLHLMPAVGYDPLYYPFVDDVRIIYDSSKTGQEWVVMRREALEKSAIVSQVFEGGGTADEIFDSLSELKPEEYRSYGSLGKAVEEAVKVIAQKSMRSNFMGVPERPSQEAKKAIREIPPFPEDMLSDDRLLELATQIVTTSLPSLWGLDRIIESKSH